MPETEDQITPAAEPTPTVTDTSEDLTKLKAALEAERKEKRQHERDLKAAQRRLESVKDIDADSYKTAMQRADAAERAAQELTEREEVRLRETENKYTAQLQEALAAKDGALQELQQQRHRYALEKHFISAEGRTEAGDDGVSAFDMFWDRLGPRFRIDHESGGLGVVDAKGDWVLDNETGRRLAVSDFIEQQKEHPLYSFLFKAKYGSGSGMGQGSDVRGVKGDDFGKMSVNEKFAAAFGQTR